MQETIIEQVAKAMWEKIPAGKLSWEGLDTRDKDQFREFARIAISVTIEALIKDADNICYGLHVNSNGGSHVYDYDLISCLKIAKDRFLSKDK
jgi:hypothetical protein